MEDKKLRQKANKILRAAKAYGVEQNFFFETTFDRYMTQIKICENLKEVIEKEGPLTEKEYVRGSKNIYAHPAVNNYNRTTDSANKTLAALLKIINAFKNNETSDDDDILLKVLNGCE